MNGKTTKFSAVIIIFIFSMFLFSCKGSIEGQLVLVESEGETSYTNVDDWPGDTTSKMVVICIEDEDAEEVCYNVVIEEPEVDEPIDDAGDTISYNFRDLRPGDYRLGIYFQEVVAGAAGDRELITFYHSALDTLGLIKDRGSSETIPITFFRRNIDLGIIEIPY